MQGFLRLAMGSYFLRSAYKSEGKTFLRIFICRVNELISKTDMLFQVNVGIAMDVARVTGTER